MSTDHNLLRERRAEADSNRGPSAYQPNALPLGQTGSPSPTVLVQVSLMSSHHATTSTIASISLRCVRNTSEISRRMLAKTHPCNVRTLLSSQAATESSVYHILVKKKVPMSEALSVLATLYEFWSRCFSFDSLTGWWALEAAQNWAQVFPRQLYPL